MASLASKVFAITGGASGMGLATGRILAEAKAKAICIGDFNDMAFDEVRKELQAISPETDVHTTKLDVSSPLSVKAWISDIVTKYGALDGAVNAAGIAQQVGARKSPAILEETDDLWTRTIGVNLNGVFYCCREQIRAMSDFPKRTCSIVNIASIAAMMHGPDCYGYGVSKAGVAYFTASVAKDVLGLDIRVNCVSPGEFSSITWSETGWLTQ
jgi:chanoclavine-I dehydrogenase